MKTKIYTFAFAWLLAFAANAQQLQSPQKTQLPQGVEEDWYAKASEAIEKMEYAFKPSLQNEQYSVANPAKRLGFRIHSSGYEVYQLHNNNSQAQWKVLFSLNSYGRTDHPLSFNAGSAMIDNSSTLVFQSATVDVEYVNDREGLRQNFIIKDRPAGDGALEIKMKIESSLAAELVNDDQLRFSAPGNKNDIKLFYEGLRVWDAAHKPLQAKMEFDNSTNTLTLKVIDNNASYPITVDPLNKTPEWTTSADGVLPGLLTNLQLQVQTTYGYTVAGLGDINGDNYDDVAVSAPTMADVISGTGSLTGVGAVFIYLGSPTGLPVMPSKVLQPTTAVSGALFGLSIDAGDITGDGRNDIIIGAPLDRYQTTAAGLFGDVNVNVTAGKVYFYRSEDLFTAANPTPFLQIRLQGSSYFNTILNNVTVNPLFGYSVAVTDDLNGDSRPDIVIGCPAYLRGELLAVKNGAAFVYYSNNLSTTAPVQLDLPTPSLLGITLLPILNSTGLLFGYSVDGAGDFNMDGRPDVVVGAPAGVDLTSLGLSGQFLGGSAYVYYGNAAGTGINTTIGAKLQAAPGGLLSNAANLFGFDVKGVRTVANVRNGNILVGAPSGSVISNVLNGLRVKAGQVHVFVRSNSLPANPATSPVVSTQTISSPRSSSILSILSGQTINVSLLYGSSMDNMLDVNCDGIGDIIVGEPLSTAVPLIGADVVGGAAYVYLGLPNGTYVSTPFWDLYTTVSPLLGVNTTSLLGYSVAGARYVRGRSQGVRALVGGPSNSLDFGVGLLNLGNTLGTTFDFVLDDNGLGKSYTFPFMSCNITLPATIVEFRGQKRNSEVLVNWTTVTEENLDYYELQRSTDGSRFEPIATLNALEQLRNTYAYTDRHPAMGVNYYRLRIVDNNGSFRYSAIVNVRFDQKLPADVIVAPNPVVAADIRMKFVGLEAGKYKMELYSTAGQLLQTKTVQVNQFDQVVTMPRSFNTPAGMYWLKIYDDRQNEIKSVKVYMHNE